MVDQVLWSTPRKDVDLVAWATSGSTLYVLKVLKNTLLGKNWSPNAGNFSFFKNQGSLNKWLIEWLKLQQIFFPKFLPNPFLHLPRFDFPESFFRATLRSWCCTPGCSRCGCGCCRCRPGRRSSRCARLPLPSSYKLRIYNQRLIYWLWSKQQTLSRADPLTWDCKRGTYTLCEKWPWSEKLFSNR